MVIAVFASVSTEACVGVLFWVVFLMVMFWLVMFWLIMVMSEVWWLNADLDSYWFFVNDRERNVFLVVDWTVDWNVDCIRHGLFDDIRNLSNNFIGLWNWNLHGHCNLLLNMNWVWSVWEIQTILMFLVN